MAQETIGSDVGIDSSVWNATDGIREGITMALPGNEFLNSQQIRGLPTNSPTSYEKAATIIQIVQDDPSDYSRGIERDLTGAEIQLKARTTNTRLWGLSFIISKLRGIVAMITGVEIDADNDGDFEPYPDTPNSSYMLQLVGTKNPTNSPLTSAVYCERGMGPGHHRIFVMREDAFANTTDRAFMAILYAGTNRVKHLIGPDGIILDGRKLHVMGLPDGAGNWHEFVVREKPDGSL